MKPALGNLSALSKCIIENKCFLTKFFGKQRFSQRASSICSSLVRTEGWGRMCKMDGVYCIYVQKPESEIDLISYLDRVIRQNLFFFFKTTAIRTVKPGLQICSKKVSKEISVCPTSCTLIFFYTASLLVSAKSSKQSTSFLTTRSPTH